MGVGISPERGERVERAVGGRPERILEPETELLVGRVPEADAPAGSRPGAAAASTREPGAAASGSGGTVTAEQPSRTRTTQVRPFFTDGPTFDDGPTAGPPPDAEPASDPWAPASWEESGTRESTGEPANGHDPHEVTIQLDRASDEAAARSGRTAAGRPGKDAPATAEDRPVFVDASGRRSRRFRRLGMLVAVACAVYAVVIAATLVSGNSNAPWLPVPGQEEDTPAGKVETSPLPTQRVNPSGTGAAPVPGGAPRASDGTTPLPSSTATGASASASATGASGDPRPSTSATKKPNPGTTPKDPDPDPEPSASADGQPTASAPATTPGGTPAPTETTGTTGAAGAGAGTE
ncbi:hypothetical protein AB0F46_11415 [Streptomyces sp. NPDC026665]|uniref:hypothetical protein n=1 Tax=Streptomyces sp. NPDC026665 TaxID=3154798 RepID=UPI0033C20ABD